ncbi:MAG: hypothetical protein AAGC74_07185 [Verrucomicrobiota bacterium]
MSGVASEETSWGAFNGQEGRQRLVKSLLKELKIGTFVETGTYRGETAEWAVEAGMRVFTVEVDESKREVLEGKFGGVEGVTLRMGDSREFLQGLISEVRCPLQRVMFYLDAHWCDDVPLRREVELITAYWRRSVIVIDDFEVPGDAGYGYDAYPSGLALRQDYLRPLPVHYFWPKMSSEEETGAKRGCAVLAWEEAMVEELGGVAGLRRG